MADLIDHANEQEEKELNMRLQQRKPEGPKHTGRCLYCGKELTDRRWCNAHCRDEWQEDQ